MAEVNGPAKPQPSLLHPHAAVTLAEVEPEERITPVLRILPFSPIDLILRHFPTPMKFLNTGRLTGCVSGKGEVGGRPHPGPSPSAKHPGLSIFADKALL
jgi:hypothetical protein